MKNEEIINAIMGLPTYDYNQAVKEDIIERLSYNEEDYFDEIAEALNNDNADDLREKLYEDCWTADSVTGNGSGSYFFNSAKAQAALIDNWDLIEEVQREFGELELSKGAEYIDVRIRCYLLGQVIDDAIEEYLDSLTEEEKEKYIVEEEEEEETDNE